MYCAQLGQHPLVRTNETSPERSSGNLSCLSGRPPDLAFWTGTRPRGWWWVCPQSTLPEHWVPFQNSKIARRRRDPRGRVIDKACHNRSFLSVSSFERTSPQPWNYPIK